MPENPNEMTCDEFQKELAESGIEIANHPHAKACENCRGYLHDLFRDLQRIAEDTPDWGSRNDGLGIDDWPEST